MLSLAKSGTNDNKWIITCGIKKKKFYVHTVTNTVTSIYTNLYVREAGRRESSLLQ